MSNSEQKSTRCGSVGPVRSPVRAPFIMATAHLRIVALTAVTILAVGLGMVEPTAFAAKPSPDALVADLKSDSPATVSAAFQGLVEHGPAAVPALESCLDDATVRLACAEVLSLLPASYSGAVLLRALERAPSASSSDRYYRSYLVGAIGRVKPSEAVPKLSSMYEQQERKDDQLALALAWALREITGKDYGPAFDPWQQGK